MKKAQKKLYIIVAVAFILIAIATGIIIWFLSNQETVSKALKLGNEYLSELDYDSAIKEYSKVLTLDPLNEEALTGLAMSYAGQGNVEMATSLFSNDLGNTKDIDVLRSYAQFLEKIQRYPSAVNIIYRIVEMEDNDDDYKWLNDVLEKSMNTRHDYAESTSNSISMEDKTVYTMGSNVLGALGITTGLGSLSSTSQLAEAGFSGNARSVYTTGAGTAVIDENDTLWLAGSNRSGQKANSSVEMLATSGWTEVTTLQKVAKVAGIGNTTFALTKSGELYIIGGNNSYLSGASWVSDWTKISGYGKIRDIQCSSNITAFLTVDGKLYMNYYTDYYGYYEVTARWSCIADNVSVYSVKTDDVTYYTADGFINDYNRYISFPENWAVYDESGYTYLGSKPLFGVKGIAFVEDSLFLLADDGILYMVNSTTVKEVSMNGSIDSIYSTGTSCVVQFEDGEYQLLDSSGAVKTL